MWDMKTLLEGETPPAGRGHFLVCVASKSGRFLATAQGWMHACSVVQVNEYLGNTENHFGFVRAACMLPNEDGLLVLDHGHSGDYMVSR